MRFPENGIRDRVVMLLETLKSNNKEQTLEEAVTAVIKFQPTLTQSDWKELIRVAQQHTDETSSFASPESETVVTKHTYYTEYSFGDTISSQGQLHQRIIRVIEGSCVAERVCDLPDGKTSSRSLYTLGMEEVAGESSFFVSDTSHYSLIANEAAVTVLEISGTFVQTIFFAQNPQAVVRFYDFFCRSLAARVLRSFAALQDNDNIN
jgi:hypothetical protein